MENYNGKVAVVTGSSAGIGAAISKALVKRGMKVVGLARRVEKLEELKKQVSKEPGQFYGVKCDIQNEKDIIGAFEWVEKNLGGVDVLINNAGLMKDTNLTEGDTEKWRTVFDTNVVGLCIATREAVKSMKKRNVPGHVIHINSLSGHRVYPGMAHMSNVYSASKFAVRALAETLRLELEHHKLKIKVSNISPGYVKTEFFSASGYAVPEAFNDMAHLNPEDLADAVIYALSAPSNVNVSEITLHPI
ncbi:farnesol dehydrogenase-like [Chrysoperla carnea]|uniref:farnesol dehydrogenase-like n=1 Tax=Chrysoperla carnea TaxID=189513 RepID=UPI001D063A09|nr:farnesol dehydrogenase-like [Chrysoperla carnea]